MENENVVPRVDTDNTPESMDEWFELEGEEMKERSSALRAKSGLDDVDSLTGGTMCVCLWW